MKTGDNTFDDIYISKKTGKVVGVMYEDVDYKLVPVEPKQKKMNYEEALKRAEKLLSMGDYVDYKLVPLNKCDIPLGQLADHINNYVYRKEDEK